MNEQNKKEHSLFRINKKNNILPKLVHNSSSN